MAAFIPSVRKLLAIPRRKNTTYSFGICGNHGIRVLNKSMKLCYKIKKWYTNKQTIQWNLDTVYQEKLEMLISLSVLQPTIGYAKSLMIHYNWILLAVGTQHF